VNPGSTAQYQLSVASVGGLFSNTVSLSCSGAPTESRCSISPTSLVPGNAPVVVSVSTTAPVAAVALPGSSWRGPTILALLIPWPWFGALGMVVGRKKWRKKLAIPVALALLAGALLFLPACAGGTGIAPQPQPGTSPGTYTITVTGGSGTLQHTLSLTLTVK
jgi:hypothetical protein